MSLSKLQASIGITAFVLAHSTIVHALPPPPPTTQEETKPKDAYVYEAVSVGDLKPEGGLGDDILIRVVNLRQWLEKLNRRPGSVNNARTWGPTDLVPIINGIPLPGTHPRSVQVDDAQADDKANGIYKLTTLQFHLANDSDAQAAWNNLLNHPQFRKPATVTVGVEAADVEPVQTIVSRDAGYKSFSLIVIRAGWPLVIGIILIIASLFVFFWLAKKTTLLRDTTSPRRPDNEFPFSLARLQMAFWFFLVIVSFFLLWIVTGAQDTITSSVLTLIGISAGTALGAAAVDSGKRNDEPSYKPLAESGPQAVSKLKEQMDAWKKALATSESLLSAALTTGASAAEVEAAKRRVMSDRDAVERTREVLEFCQRKPGTRLMFDLLGDGGVIGFHRFQIAVWTLVLGIIFITEVYNQLAMPNFSGTLLGLMGISAGTYIGFKIPEGTRPGT